MKLVQVCKNGNCIFVRAEYVTGWAIAMNSTAPRKRGGSSQPPGWTVTMLFLEDGKSVEREYVYDTREEAYAAVKVIDL